MKRLLFATLLLALSGCASAKLPKPSGNCYTWDETDYLVHYVCRRADTPQIDPVAPKP